MRKIIMLLLARVIFIPAAVSAYEVKYEFWLVQPHGGIAYPIGDVDNYVDFGFNGGVSVRKGFDVEISAGGSVNYILLPYKDPDAPGPFSATVFAGEVVYAPYMPDFFIWPYVKGALGLFLIQYSRTNALDEDEHAEATSFGFMIGGGANYPISNEIAANFEVMFNQVSLEGGTSDNYTFFTFNAGVTIYLK